MLSLFKRRGTIIAEGLKIVGSVTAEGLVEVNGHIEGDLHCTSLVVSRKASIAGSVEADQIVVNGRVEGPFGGEVVLKSHAHVVGDIQHQSLAVESGAYFDGRSVRTSPTNVRRTVKLNGLKRREPVANGREAPSAPSAVSDLRMRVGGIT
jgi:cytoskeletal protein CcmA (bactofilin family)